MNDQSVSWRHQFFLLRRAAVSAPFLAQLPVVPLATLFPGISELSVAVQHEFKPRGLPNGEAYVLSLITAYLRPQRIFEIGTGRGEATLLMARQAPDARIETLDLGDAASSLGAHRADAPLERELVGSAFRGSQHRGRITQHYGDSADFDYEPFKGQMGLVFVDGAHNLDCVRSDSRSALAMVAPGGTILWDDCALYHPGVSRALREVRRKGVPVNRLDSTRFAAARP